MTQTGKNRRTWKKIERIFTGTILVVLGLFLFLFLIVQTPPVQNLVRNKMVSYLERKLETRVSIGHMNVGFDQLSLQNLYLEDRQQDTLMAGGNAVIRLNLLKLLFSNKLEIASISLEDFTANVNRVLPDTAYNFQFIVDAFTKPREPRADTGTITYAIPVVQFRNIRFRYEDVITGVNTQGYLEELDTRIDALDPETVHIDLPSMEITGLNASIYQYKPLVQLSDIRSDTLTIESYPLLALGKTKLKNIRLDFQNHISSVFTNIRIGEFEMEGEDFDFANRRISLDLLSLTNSAADIRLGRTEQAKIVEIVVDQEVKKLAQRGWRIAVKELDLRNNDISFNNDNKSQSGTGMDYAHLQTRDFTLYVEDFLFSPDSIGGRIKDASVKEKSGFVLEELRGNVLYSNQAIFLEDLFLKTPGSEVKRAARLDYASINELTRNFPATQMDFDISDSYVKVSDILTFAPALARQPAFSNPSETWFLNLQGSGSLASFHIDELQFTGLKDTRINATGSLAISGNANQTGGALTIRQLHTTQSDIALFTGSRLSKGKLRIPEELDVTGTVRGGMNGVVANLDINTSAGRLFVDGHINNLSNAASSEYAADIRTGNLDIGSIFGDPKAGILSSDLTFSGKGLSAGNFNTDFKGIVHAVGYNNYVYRNITMNGTLHGSSLLVNADVDDPNIDLNGKLVATLGASPSFQFNGFVDSIKLQPLHLSNKPVIVRGKVDADVPVLTSDFMEADILITQALLVSASQRLPLDTVRFVAGRNDSVQYMNLTSDVASADLRGQFRLSDLGKMFQHSVQPYFATSGRNISVRQPYSVAFTADIANVPVLKDLVPGLGTFEPIHIEGILTSEAGLNANANTSLLNYNGNLLQGLQLNISTNANGLAFNGEVQRLKSKSLDVYRTYVSGIANNNRIDFHMGMDDAASRPRYVLGGTIDQSSAGTYILSLYQDSLLLNYERWNVSAGNQLIIRRDQILARNFVLSKGPEIIALDSDGEILNARFTNFQLSTITGFLKSDSLLLNGRMTGTMAFRNILRQPVFTSDLNIIDLAVQGDTLGNASIKIDNLSGNRYNTNATITGRGNDISLRGSFSPLGERDILLDLDLAVRQLQLSTIDGALGFIKNSSGTVNGNIRIGGSIARPSINGPLKFNNASFALSVLGSQFRIDGEELVVTENGFRFDDFVIRDTSNQTMFLNGFLQTTDFMNYSFNLDVRSDHFKLLNTTKKDNKIYYGDLVITSDLHIGGNTDKPIVDGSLTVNDGTNMTIVIPQRQPGIISREGIVEFVDMENPALDTLFRAYDSLDTAPFTGMDIAANIEIRKEAIFNIVIDEANGDFLNIQGEAQITTGIDPSGKITMVGNYELERGAYEITFNFLKRRFDIEKGSRIQWFNEPTRATLDVTAVYIANTAPIELVQQQIEAATPAIRNTYLQRLPFEVRLKLAGELLQPEVAFDIVLPENKSYGVSNDIITQVDSRLAQIRSDPGEMNKQVFALLLLNRFVGENPLASSQDLFSGSRFVRQSVSKLLTEQLNELAAGLIDGVDLHFDVLTSEDYTTGARRSRTDLSVGLSKQLLNERLTVSVGTNFELEGQRQTSQGSSSALGNLSVEYALSRDRRYLIRFYRKNEYQGIVDGYVIESGLSFVISVDYEKFRELITKSKRQKVEGVK